MSGLATLAAMSTQKKKHNFYQQLDIVFDDLYAKYGHTDELFQHKNDLLYVYENERGWRAAEILKMIKPKHWRIDADGKIVQILS